MIEMLKLGGDKEVIESLGLDLSGAAHFVQYIGEGESFPILSSMDDYGTRLLDLSEVALLIEELKKVLAHGDLSHYQAAIVGKDAKELDKNMAEYEKHRLAMNKKELVQIIAFLEAPSDAQYLSCEGD
ncbi:hypothetical protein KBB08_01245 [Candidatus Gracilibacteria bacterium]|nr:hypothetical protein [Candidatus Gracilibacteria bacterium]